MKKLIILSFVVLGVTFLTGCGKQKSSKIQSTTSTSVSQQRTTDQPIATQSASTTPILFDDMGRQLSENFLKENKIQATYKMIGGGNNYYKYFKESKEVTKANGFADDLLPAKLKNFILDNCPEKIYTPNSDGATMIFDKYIYQLGKDEKYNRKFIEILVDSPASEVVCYWIRDEKTGEFERINQ